ncbi:hypothetical protein ACWEN6_24865 [Sphaerisporangium sp. NPDC004334]
MTSAAPAASDLRNGSARLGARQVRASGIVRESGPLTHPRATIDVTPAVPASVQTTSGVDHPARTGREHATKHPDHTDALPTPYVGDLMNDNVLTVKIWRG